MKKKKFNRLRAIDEATIDGLQAQLRELEESVAGLVLKARADARTMAGLRLRNKEAMAEEKKALAFARKYEGERNMFFDRAVDAETKLDAAMVEVENKKAWYDMKLVGEVDLRKQLERRIAELEGRT